MSTGEPRFPFTGCAWTIFAIFLLVLGLVAWTGSGLLSVPLCQNKIMHEVLSPDGHLKMVVFCRDCGSTTGFNSQGSIIGVGEHLPDKAGTIFISDKDEAIVSWTEPHRLVVTFKGTGPDFKLEKQFQGIAIDYR